MNLRSNKLSLIVLGLTSIVIVRVMFWFFDDPEGPNLLIVIVMAGVVYLMSLVVYLFNSRSLKAFIFAILIQILIVMSMYFLFQLKF